MLRVYCQRLALLLFALYVAVFPGSTITVALDRVPPWGVWMGSALLIVQGATMLAWLIGRYEGWGLLGGICIGLLALVVEYAGVVTGMPFGHYAYTNVLQPQVFATVPLAVCCAWIAIAATAYELTRTALGGWITAHRLIAAAMLVMLLDLQIETVATGANHYWVWSEQGLYYGVPTVNFVSWWLIGLLMAWMLSKVEVQAEKAGSISPNTKIGFQGARDQGSRSRSFSCTCARGAHGVTDVNIATSDQGPGAREQEPTTEDPRHSSLVTRHSSLVRNQGHLLHFSQRVLWAIPSLLYMMNVTMFTVINLARGYIIAGFVGLAVFIVGGTLLIRYWPGVVGRSLLRRRFD